MHDATIFMPSWRMNKTQGRGAFSSGQNNTTSGAFNLADLLSAIAASKKWAGEHQHMSSWAINSLSAQKIWSMENNRLSGDAAGALSPHVNATKMLMGRDWFSTSVRVSSLEASLSRARIQLPSPKTDRRGIKIQTSPGDAGPRSLAARLQVMTVNTK